MKKILFIPVILLLAQCATRNTTERPPLAETNPVEDVYFGKKIIDSYRYMENLKDSVVDQWFRTQSNFARSVLNKIPGRDSLIDKMVEFDQRRSAKVYALKVTDNDRYFYLKMTPDDEAGELCYRDGYEGKETMLYDPATFSSDTTKKYVISNLSPSFDGTKIAFEVAPNGSESAILLSMDVATKKLYPEQIDRCWFTNPSWLPDGNSFLYNRLQSADVHDVNREKNSKAFLHQVGTDPATDREIFSREKYPELAIRSKDIPMVYYDKDNHYLFGITATVDNRINAFYAPLAELKKEKIAWKHLFKWHDEVYNYYATDKDLYVYTPKNAPNFKIIKTSLQNPDLSTAETVVPEDPDATITSFSLTHDALYYTTSRNGVKGKFYRLPHAAKKATELNLPFAAGVIYLNTKGINFSDVWVTLSGWTHDYQRYRYLTDQNQFRPENLSSVAEYPEYADLTVEELMVPSHDGVEVPLSLIYKKGTQKNGKNPVLIYGYGAYGYSINTFFSPNFLLWTHEGGILAIAHVRGGGELGDAWHKAGFKTTKPNTWKDLISCTQYLIDQKYTSTKKIAINGASAGGILIGRAMTERPDLFAAAIPEVGLLNPLRSEVSPNGPVNTPEFGTVKDSAECMALIEMDAYLHVEDKVKYPATLITAGMNDPRVIAWEPAKFAARLQTANRSNKPVLFLADYEAGHGVGNTKSKDFENLADVYSFALWQTGHPKFQVD